jgi:hypothetical protein
MNVIRTGPVLPSGASRHRRYCHHVEGAGGVVIRRFLWGAVAGLLFAVMCVFAAVKSLVARVFEGKQPQRPECPQGGLLHAAGECPWCDQQQADAHRDALIAEGRKRP